MWLAVWLPLVFQMAKYEITRLKQKWKRPWVLRHQGQSKMLRLWQLQHPNLQVQSALESSGFEVWSGWQCHWKASNWQVLSFYFKESWIFWPSLSLNLSPKQSNQQWIWINSMQLLSIDTASQEDLAAASALHDLNAPPCYSTLSPTSWVPFTAQGHWTKFTPRN